MKSPVSAKQNKFFNGQAVDFSNLTLEQDYNNLIQTGIISNHIGNGVLPDSLNQNVIFDTNLATGLLDGKAFSVQLQPTDTNFGNQLEVSLTNSNVASKRTIKFVIIGLDFEGNLQYDRFTFHKNEKQVSKKHYTKVLKVIFNDYIGDINQSLNLGGRIVIKETKSLTLSRDCLMISQDLQPNIFFRDFFVPIGETLNHTLTVALPSYNIDTLNIETDPLQLRGITENDVSSQIGQKFQATTNNIQKISLLLAVSNGVDPTNLNWTGDLIVSLYPLQSTLDCALDIAPGTAIDFDPSNIPLAQLSLNFDSLFASGFQLNETPQPIDFVFSNTPVGMGSLITAGSYYTIAIKRAGSADTCVIQLATGTDQTPNSRLTLFNGSIWVDVPDEDLWFQVWTDSAKVADGQAYDDGHGIIVPKTTIDGTTGITEDYTLDNVQFIRNDTYYGLIEAVSEDSVPTQDQRTGERVLSEQQFVPQLSLLTATQLLQKEEASDPLLIGTIADQNMKIISANTTNVPGKFHQFSMIGNKCIFKIIDDPSDTQRYDLDILNLVTEMTGSGGVSNINGLVNAKFIPNLSNPNTFYRIAETELISMIYGDLNGDGVVDSDDLLEFQTLVGSNLNVIPTSANYTTLTTLFQTDTALTWQFLDTNGITVLDSGADGYLTANPADGTMALFGSPTVAFNSFLPLTGKFIKISGDVSNPGNNGTFGITGLVDNTHADIQKQYYTSDTILQVLRADINGDMIVDATDLALMTNYINKVAPFPANTAPGNKVGTSFNAIRFTLEEFVDRSDDFTSSGTRAADLHALPDIITDGYTSGFPLYSLNLQTSPLQFNIVKQMTWFDWFVNSSSNPKQVPAAFNYESGFVQNNCSLEGIVNEQYPLLPDFDPGRTDVFVPNNLVIGSGGNLMTVDGYFHAVDLEVCNITLVLPTTIFLGGEKRLNVFTDLVADFDGNGRTRLGYECCRFADCSTVDINALNNQQVRFNIAIQSLSPTIDGYWISNTDISGVLVDGRTGLYFDHDTGILTIDFNNVSQDIILQTMSTKIQIVLYLKKGKFNNTSRTISSTVVGNIFGF